MTTDYGNFENLPKEEKERIFQQWVKNVQPMEILRELLGMSEETWEAFEEEAKGSEVLFEELGQYIPEACFDDDMHVAEAVWDTLVHFVRILLKHREKDVPGNIMAMEAPGEAIDD